jgi:catalase (peroxidase I)
MEEDHKTKAARDEGVEKHSCQIEWRGTHVNLVYYNGKQVLRAYSMIYVTVFLHVRSEDEKSPIVGDEMMHMGSTLLPMIPW